MFFVLFISFCLFDMVCTAHLLIVCSSLEKQRYCFTFYQNNREEEDGFAGKILWLKKKFCFFLQELTSQACLARMLHWQICFFFLWFLFVCLFVFLIISFSYTFHIFSYKVNRSVTAFLMSVDLRTYLALPTVMFFWHELQNQIPFRVVGCLCVCDWMCLIYV